MILAAVRTCPQRWQSYQKLLHNFGSLDLPVAVRTFQTAESAENSCVNSRLTARAALAYCDKHLPDAPGSWALFLEDDVELHSALPGILDWMVEYGTAQHVDCWYLCNRKNAVTRQFALNGLNINELDWPILGSHALLISKRHLKPMLETHWTGPCDIEMFAAIRHPQLRVLQIVSPVLAEHRGEFSTFNPNQRQQLEVNHANPSNPCAA